MTDIVYLAWNRKRFTMQTFDNLLKSTPWEEVGRLVVYDDGSEDGTKEWLYERIHDCPAQYELVEMPNVGPVGIMNHYIDNYGSELFAKIDNDIMVPPGWFDALHSVLERWPYVEVLGMEAGRMGSEPWPDENPYGLEPARWIGGVGLFRTEALGRRPAMVPNGRYGWTEHQQSYNIAAAWIKPDLMVCSLDQVPVEPWVGWAEHYVEQGWARQWGKYHERWMAPYWEWFS
jgi:glycosyltransferase involved in cell wall biosynthesis